MKGRGARLWRYGWPCLVYALVIAWWSHQPGRQLPALHVPDKTAHAVEYLPLGFLCWRWVRWGWGAAGWPAGVGAWLVAALYGALDEVHQAFIPGRSADPADWAWDAAGAAVGVVLAGWLALRRERIKGDPRQGR